MSGPGAIAAYYGGTGRNQILSQTLAAVTETEFKIGNDSASTSVIAVLSLPTQSLILGSQSPIDQTINPSLLDASFARQGYAAAPMVPYNSGVFDNDKPFLVRLAGTITPASNAGNTYKATLYLGTTKAGVALTSVSAAAQATSVAPFGFLLEAQLHWDSLAQVVIGQYWYDFNGTTRSYNTWAATTNPTTATAAAVANIQFCATSTWGNGVGGVAAVSEFSITQL
jgi:hypothetical protein